MEAAETGHLVFGTVHITDIASSISRIVQMFPTSEQTAARVQLLSSLRYFMCQLFAYRENGSRIAVREHLEFTPELRKRLLELTPAQLYNELQDTVATEGVTMMGAIRAIHTQGEITNDELRRWELMLQSSGT